MSGLVLKPDGSADFFEVYADAKRVGRIFKANAAPAERPWFWTIVWFDWLGDGPHQGNEPTKKAAMAAFKAEWLRRARAEVPR